MINKDKYGINFAADYKKIDELIEDQAKHPYIAITEEDIEYGLESEVDENNTFIADKYQTGYAEILEPIFNKLAGISQKRISENTLIKNLINKFNMINELKTEQEKILNDEVALTNFFNKDINNTAQFQYPGEYRNNLVINNHIIPNNYKNLYTSCLSQENYVSNMGLFYGGEDIDLNAFGKTNEETEKLSDELRAKNLDLYEKKNKALLTSKRRKLNNKINLNETELKQYARKSRFERTIDYCNKELNKLATTIDEIKNQIDLEVVQEFFTEHPKYLECNFSNIGMPVMVQVVLKQMIKERESMKTKNNSNTEKRAEEVYNEGLER